MVFKVIGVMSGSSLDGLDLVFASFQERAGVWDFQILHTACYPYDDHWRSSLLGAVDLGAREYLVLDRAYGRFIGECINRFIREYQLDFQVNFISSHGHTSFHHPERRMTAQLGEGAAIAASTGLPVISDLRSLDVALGGQGAPIVPMGEKWLFGEYELLLNLGGIANISCQAAGSFRAFDICPANRVLDRLAGLQGLPFDEGGKLAASGTLLQDILDRLNALPYYQMPFPKSLDNAFGDEVVWPLVSNGISPADGLRTYCEHISEQTVYSLDLLDWHQPARMLVTGGGALNSFLTERIRALTAPRQVTTVIGDDTIIRYKEALIMAFLGVLRWRQQDTVMASVTGASRDSSGGSIWSGKDR